MAEYFVHESAEVSANAKIGRGTKIWHQSQIRENVVIGENCVISKGVYIDHGVQIGDRVKIQNGVSIYKGVEVGDEVFIGPNATFTNDLRPRSFDVNWVIAPTYLRRGVSIGANATVLCGITLGEFCMISAGAVITVDALPYGLYIGNPARLKGFVSRKGHEMSLESSQPGLWQFACPESSERVRIRFETSEADE